MTATAVSKSYPTPRGELSVLRDVSCSLPRGDAAAIMGPSGSGKSTLLYILGALDPPSAGTVTLDGQDPYALSEREQEVFNLLGQGHQVREIAQMLDLAPKTIHAHRLNIMHKLKVKNAARLNYLAFERAPKQPGA